MSQLLSVRGGRRLEGEVTIQGAKNSVLPILAATLLARGQVALLGCPRLRDVDASIRRTFCGIWAAKPGGRATAAGAGSFRSRQKVPLSGTSRTR